LRLHFLARKILDFTLNESSEPGIMCQGCGQMRLTVFRQTSVYYEALIELAKVGATSGGGVVMKGRSKYIVPPYNK